MVSSDIVKKFRYGSAPELSVGSTEPGYVRSASDVPILYPRRLLLQQSVSLVGIGAIAALGGSLLGCGGGGSPVGSTSTVTASINPAEVQGTGLTLTNSLAKDVAPGAGGTYNVVASGQAQVVFVRDAAGKLRGAGVSSGHGGSLTIDAESSTLAVLMATPGIGNADPKIWASNKSAVLALAEFLPAVAAVRASLSGGATFADALATPAVIDAISACVQAYANTRSRKSFAVLAGSPRYESKISVSDAKDPTPIISISNSSWRYVRIVRRTSNTNGATVAVEQLNSALGGATGLSIGSILSGTVAGQGEMIDVGTDFNAYSKAEYIFQSIGLQSSQPMPDGVDIQDQTAILKSIILYAFFPVVDAVMGIKAAGQTFASMVDKVYSAVSGSVNLNSIHAATTTAELAKAILDVVVSLIGIAVTFTVFSAAQWMTPAAEATMGALLLASALCLCPANFLVVAHSWSSLPSRHILTVTATGTTGVTIS